MGGLPAKLQALADEIDTLLGEGKPLSPEIAARLYGEVDFSRAGITLKDVEWLCWQRPAEINNFCKGGKLADLKESIILDQEIRYPVGYYEEGRSGLG